MVELVSRRKESEGQILAGPKSADDVIVVSVVFRLNEHPINAITSPAPASRTQRLGLPRWAGGHTV